MKIENMTARQLCRPDAAGIPLLVHILRENPLAGDHELWGLRMQDGATLAHWAARYGALPHDFRRWMLRDEQLKTVAHEALEHGLSKDNLRLDFPPGWVTWNGRSLDLMDIGSTPWDEEDGRLYKLIRNPDAMMDALRQWPSLPFIVRQAVLQGETEITFEQWFKQNGFHRDTYNNFSELPPIRIQWTAVRLALGATSQQMQREFPEVWKKPQRNQTIRQASQFAGGCPPGLLWKELDAQDKMAVIFGILDACSYDRWKEKSFAMRQRAAKSIDWNDIDVLQPVSISTKNHDEPARPLIHALIEAGLLPGHDAHHMRRLRQICQETGKELVESFDYAALCCGFMTQECTTLRDANPEKHILGLRMALHTGCLPEDYPLFEDILKIYRHGADEKTVWMITNDIIGKAPEQMILKLPPQLFEMHYLGLACAREVIARGIDHPAAKEVMKKPFKNWHQFLSSIFSDNHIKPVPLDVSALIRSTNIKSRKNLIKNIAESASFSLLPQSVWIYDAEILRIMGRKRDLSSIIDPHVIVKKNKQSKSIKTALLNSGNLPISFILSDRSLADHPVRLSMLPLGDPRVIDTIFASRFNDVHEVLPVKFMDGARNIDWKAMPHDQAIRLAQWIYTVWFQWLDPRSGVTIHRDPDLAETRTKFLLEVLEGGIMMNMDAQSIHEMLDSGFWNAKAPRNKGTMFDVLKKISFTPGEAPSRAKAKDLLDVIYQQESNDLRQTSKSISQRLQEMDF